MISHPSPLDRFRELFPQQGPDSSGYEFTKHTNTSHNCADLFDARKEIESFLSDALAEEYARGRRDVIEETFKIHEERWKDVVHCTCLGYALVQVSGGEESVGGKEMEARLLESARTHEN